RLFSETFLNSAWLCRIFTLYCLLALKFYSMIKFSFFITLFFCFFFPSSPSHSQYQDFTDKPPVILQVAPNSLDKFSLNKIIPEEIEEITLLALSYFPELLEVEIDFQFQKNINGSVMQAQPKVGSLLFDNKDNRSYRVKISRYL